MGDYKKKYEQALENFKKIKDANKDNNELVNFIEYEYPELKESEDERIRKWLIEMVEVLRKANPTNADHNGNCSDAIAWLEKQGKIKRQDYPYIPGWRENRPDNKPKIKHSILMLTTHGVAEGEWLGEEWGQYRWSCKIKDTEVLYWLHLSDLETLEKENVEQGEQKSTDKVELKFKVGDWIIGNKQINCTNSIMRINKVGLTDYQCQYNNGLVSYHFDFVDKNYHLWTIQDAKDGDVLAFDDAFILIFKGITDLKLEPPLFKKVRGFYFKSYVNLDFLMNVFEQGSFCCDIGHSCHPATKEQRVLLFRKMKEAGYEWDAEKKELKKIEQNHAEDNCKISDCVEKVDMTEYNNGYECGKQRVLKYPEDYGLCKKPAWSEEDEKMLQQALSTIRYALSIPLDKEDDPCFTGSSTIAWLKSLKERLKGE